jgi:hypothetical protein
MRHSIVNGGMKGDEPEITINMDWCESTEKAAKIWANELSQTLVRMADLEQTGRQCHN